MGTDFQVMLLVTLGVAAVGYAFVLDIRVSGQKSRLIEWVKTQRRAQWDALSGWDRLMTVRAIEILRRGGLADDAEFHERYQLAKHDRRFAVAMGVAVAAIALLAIGTKLGDWRW